MYRERFIAVMRAPTVGPACVIMGLTMLAFGVPFLSPWYPKFFQTQAYRNMGQLGGPVFWGMLFTSASIWRLCAALFLSYSSRKLSTVLAIFLWSLLFLLRVLAEPTNPGVTVFGTWTVVETWTLLRLNRMEFKP